MGDWDGKMKHLAALAPDDFVRWLVCDGQFVKELPTNFASREIDGDVLWDIRIKGRPTLLHLEFQVKPETIMGRRMWEYNVEACLKYKQPVHSVVIYLQKPGSPQARPPYRVQLPGGRNVHEFWYDVVELCKVETEQLLQSRLKGLLPLVPLTREGKRQEAVERVIEELLEPGVQNPEELLWLTYGLAGLVLKKENDQNWLKRRFAMLKDILEESWTFREMRDELLQKGLVEGKAKGIAEGKAEGKAEGIAEGIGQMRQAVVDIVQECCPELAQLAKDVVAPVTDLTQLRHLLVKLSSSAHSPEQARQVLLAFGQ
jgi:predicted transposase YdaD